MDVGFRGLGFMLLASAVLRLQLCLGPKGLFIANTAGKNNVPITHSSFRGLNYSRPQTLNP